MENVSQLTPSVKQWENYVRRKVITYQVALKINMSDIERILFKKNERHLCHTERTVEKVKACTYRERLAVNTTCQILGELCKKGKYAHIKGH
jgi:hypothetical protein